MQEVGVLIKTETNQEKSFGCSWVCGAPWKRQHSPQRSMFMHVQHTLGSLLGSNANEKAANAFSRALSNPPATAPSQHPSRWTRRMRSPKTTRSGHMSYAKVAQFLEEMASNLIAMAFNLRPKSDGNYPTYSSQSPPACVAQSRSLELL